jgi:hypothetical protein
MWAEYKDRANFKKTRMLEEQKAKVYHALAAGESKPPEGAYLQDVIEVLWYNAARNHGIAGRR